MAERRLVWLRNDLRLTDNPALTHVCSREGAVVAVVTLTPASWQAQGESPARMGLWRDQLRSVARELEQRHIPLRVLRLQHFEECAGALLQLARELSARELRSTWSTRSTSGAAIRPCAQRCGRPACGCSPVMAT